ncbi:MAG: hypothetical protein JOZ53_17375, partial [Planctomycetaceae bacterium]|nr:hypothetical protein [Planctomycetaceae bacterium]
MTDRPGIPSRGDRPRGWTDPHETDRLHRDVLAPGPRGRLAEPRRQAGDLGSMIESVRITWRRLSRDLRLFFSSEVRWQAISWFVLLLV